MLETSFQLFLLKVTFCPSFAILQGPSSNNNPVEELQPGPNEQIRRYMALGSA